MRQDELSAPRFVHGGWLWVVAVGAGLLVGVGSLYPYFATAGPAHVLGNSAAIWLAGAFAVGATAGGQRRGATAGTVMLLVTVAAFLRGVQVLYPQDSVLRVTAMWAIPAIVGGALFGMSGSFWRTGTPVAQGIASAALGSAFLAEAAYTFGQARAAAIFEAAAGAVLPFALARGRRARLAALCSLPALVLAGLLGWFLTWHLLIPAFVSGG